MLKDSAPSAHTNKPDGDNLAKAVLDELTRLNVWRDDCQIYYLMIVKMWESSLFRSGCRISLTEA